MRIEDWFRLAIRVVGLTILLIPGLLTLLDSLLLKLGYFNLPDTKVGYLLIYGATEVIAGLYLVWGAPLLVGFAYPTEYEAEDEVGTHERD